MNKPQKRDKNFDKSKKSYSKPFKKNGPKKLSPKSNIKQKDDSIRLNKFLSTSGICSRREADVFIANGLVTVNGKVVTELGTKVKPTDDVRYAGEKVKFEKPVYILLNKPKDVVTTVSDPQRRKTVIDLVKKACKERVYPVGRLDKETTGVLLLTNDGDLTKKLTHPKYGVKKIYHVTLDRPAKQGDLNNIKKGVQTEEIGFVNADEAEFIGNGENKREVGIELHSGKNRVVRRMFQAIGYKVVKLDRVYFAGLTKKNLPRGKYRFLTEKEVQLLKMLG